ncbi:MAG TPA: hypothetical protein VKB57_14995 [Acidimicrobiales bacterium]|nr:hypothetical protein [Acidimicrobiales bacterium]
MALISATTETEQTARRLQGQVSTNRTKITSLLNRGNSLASESEWTGPDASRWKGHWEGEVRSTLTRIGTQLEEIAETCTRIAGDIFRAGGG